MKIIHTLKIFSLAASLMAGSGLLAAAEMYAGDILSAANLDQRLSDTFQGETIDSLLTDVQKQLIRNEGLTITLKDPEPVKLGKDYLFGFQKVLS